MPQLVLNPNSIFIGEQFFTLYFNAELDAAHPPPLNAFDVKINSAVSSVTGIVIDSAAKTIAVSFSGPALAAGDVVWVTYHDPIGGFDDVNAIQDLNGVDAISFSGTFTGNISRPAAPSAPTLSPGSDNGTQGDGLTNDTTPTLTGTAAANATVKLYDTVGITHLGTTFTDGSGNWSFTTSTLSEGTHMLKVTQTVGLYNSHLSAPLAVTIDTTAPSVGSIVPSTTGPTNAATLTQTVTFSEAVTGVDIGDFTVTGTGTSAATVASVSGSGATYTVTLNKIAGDGQIRLDLKASGAGIQDGAGNAIAGAATGSATIVDHSAPAIVSIVPSTAGPTNATTLTQTVTLSEAVTGLDVNDFALAYTGSASARIGSITGSGTTYTVTLDGISGDGTIRLDLKSTGTGITDTAGNAITGGATGAIAIISQPTPEPETPALPPTTGGAGDDVLDLRSGGFSQIPHTFAGGAGADLVYGGDAGDTLQGNTGDDVILGGGGADLIMGGQDQDRLEGGPGRDLLFGDRGDDTLQGNTGDDIITGGAGDDVLRGGQDQDWLEGGDGRDRLFGDHGDDTLQGNIGADTLTGEAGNDVLLGGKDGDLLNGGDGADILSGDLGNDTLTGGAGADVFSFAANGGIDHITDFNAAEGDRVQLQPGAAYTLTQIGANTVVDLGHGDQLILDNIQLTALPTGWILN